MTLTRDAIAAQLQDLGLGSGDALVLHSSLSSLGWVQGGADTLIEAVLDCIGPTGTLIVPTFTYATAMFDPLVTPGRTGRVAEALRRRPDALRSLHPTHSFAAIGVQAAQWLTDHHLKAPTGIDSPLDRLARAGGHVLLLGVGHNRNTTIHVGEVYARVPYLGVPFAPDHDLSAATVCLPDGRRLTVDLQTPPGCSRGFAAFAPHLYARGRVRVGRVGSARAEVISAQEVIDAVVALLKVEPEALLCSDPVCAHCPVARQRVAAWVKGLRGDEF